MKAKDAFSDLTKPRKRNGRCYACNAETRPGERVNVRANATLLHPSEGRKNQALASRGHTYCPGCARKVFDLMANDLEIERDLLGN
jgi:hypothetical protein